MVINTNAQFYLEQGDQYFDHNNFGKAIEYYEKELDNTDVDMKKAAMEKLAKTYRMNNQHHVALSWYKQLYILDKDVPKRQLDYAHAFKRTGNLRTAKKFYQKYAEISPDDSLAGIYLASCDSAQKWMEEFDNNSEVREMRSINSKWRDFAPVNWRNSIVYNSAREDQDGQSHHSKFSSQYLDVYQFDIAPSQPVNSKPKAKYITALNTGYHEGPACFNRAGDTMYFTRTIKGEKANGIRKNSLNIFMRAKLPDGTWSSPDNNFSFNSMFHSSGQPSLSPNGQLMVYMSDNSDSLINYGGSDIFVSVKQSGGSWSKPKNLGKEANSFGNELFPSWSPDGSRLYFSSNGHAGMGGLDLYVGSFNEKSLTLSNIKNLKPPINTFNDDFGIAFMHSDSKGFFSSNRPRGTGDDDIYLFAKLKTEIHVHDDTFMVENKLYFDEIVNTWYSADNEKLVPQKLGIHEGILAKKDFPYKVESHKDNSLFNQVFVKRISATNQSSYATEVIAVNQAARAFFKVSNRSKNEKVMIYIHDVLTDSVSFDIMGRFEYNLVPEFTYRFEIPAENQTARVEQKQHFLKLQVLGEGKSLSNPKIGFSSDGLLYPESHEGDISGNWQTLVKPGKTYKISVKKTGYYVKDTIIVLPQSIADITKCNITLIPKPLINMVSQVLYKGKPVKDAEVTVTIGDEIVNSQKTNEMGYYDIKLNPDETYDISFAKSGFLIKDTSIVIKPIAGATSVEGPTVKMDEVKKGKEYKISNISYDYNSFKLTTKSKLSIRKIVTFLKYNPGLIIELGSHTDTRGDEFYNIRLSQRRADEAFNYAINLGLNPDMLIPKGYGESQPMIKDAATEEEHRKNRRTQLKIIDLVDSSTMDITYRVFLVTQKKPFAKNDPSILRFKNLKYFVTKSGVTYFTGPYADKKSADEALAEAEDAGFSDCYVEKLNNGVAIVKYE